MTKNTPSDFLSAEISPPLLDPAIFKRLADTSTQAIGMAMLDSHIVYGNATLYRLLGIDRNADITQFSFNDFYTEQDVRRLREDIIPLVRAHGEWTGEIDLRSLTGEQYQTIQNIILIRDGSGAPTSFANVITNITEHVGADANLRIQQAEMKILATQNQLKATIDAIPDLMFELGLDGTYYDVHAQRGDLLAAPALDLIGKKVSDVLPPEATEVVLSALREAQEQGSSHGKQFELSLAQGTSWFELSVSRKYTDSGQEPRFIVLSREITARKDMEQTLRTSAERLNEAQRIAKVGSWELDLLTGELVWSDEIFRLFEIDKNLFGATYEAFLHAIHPDDRDSVNHAYTHSLETRTPYEITHRLLMNDGRIKWVHERCASDFDAAGKPIRSVGTVQDITSLRQAEALLRESEARYHSVVTALSEGIVLNARDGAAIAANDSASQILGLTIDQMKGRTPIDPQWRAIHEDGTPFPGEMHPGAVTLRTGKPQSNIVMGVHKPDGTLTWISINSQPIFEPGEEQPSTVVASFSDITERKRAEAALIQLNEDLEQRVIDRTIELVSAKEEAERANSAKSEFLSRMSHELRTPMNAILGFGQLLESDPIHPLAPIQADNVQEILRGGTHLLELINEILDLARIESGRLDLSLESVVLPQLIDECMNLLQPLASEHRIHLSADSSRCFAVQADRLRLRQVLLNLLSNAIKYNREGGNVEITCYPAPEGRIRIAVRDNGRGIPVDFLPRLFQPFERIESAYVGIEGTGIGLALSKKLTEAMGGMIGVESTVGEGSTFWVAFPQAEEDVSVQMTSSEAEVSSTVCPNVQTLLYVEDNPANLRLVQKILSMRAGLEMLDANNAELGLEIARKKCPDVILLDINLPGMDGFEALIHLKKNPATRNIPVIAITANAMERDIKKGLDAGFVDYLTKPLNIEHFLMVINKVLSEPRSQ